MSLKAIILRDPADPSPHIPGECSLRSQAAVGIRIRCVQTRNERSGASPSFLPEGGREGERRGEGEGDWEQFEAGVGVRMNGAEVGAPSLVLSEESSGSPGACWEQGGAHLGAFVSSDPLGESAMAACLWHGQWHVRKIEQRPLFPPSRHPAGSLSLSVARSLGGPCVLAGEWTRTLRRWTPWQRATFGRSSIAGKASALGPSPSSQGISLSPPTPTSTPPPSAPSATMASPASWETTSSKPSRFSLPLPLSPPPSSSPSPSRLVLQGVHCRGKEAGVFRMHMVTSVNCVIWPEECEEETRVAWLFDCPSEVPSRFLPSQKR